MKNVKIVAPGGGPTTHFRLSDPAASSLAITAQASGFGVTIDDYLSPEISSAAAAAWGLTQGTGISIDSARSRILDMEASGSSTVAANLNEVVASGKLELFEIADPPEIPSF